MSELVVNMENINKSFSGVQVLRDVSLQVEQGEVHALLGENGAGKTTLMKILTAEFLKDSGTVFVHGQEANFQHPQDAMSHGIAFVHQELSILENLTVGENIFLGRVPKKLGLIDWKTLYRQSNEILKKLNVDFTAETPAETLSTGQLQMVEIAKALSMSANIFILDEPTASLSSEESLRLFEMMKTMTKNGNSFIYISHRLKEVLEISNRITVLRDGMTISTVDADKVDPVTLSELIIGRKLSYNEDDMQRRVEGEPVLRARNIVANKVDHVDIDLYPGEIVSLYGLVGAGRTELIRAILGIDRRAEGTVEIGGQSIASNYVTMLRKGVGFLPEERKTQAIFTGLPLFHNITLTNLGRVRKGGLINYAQERKMTNSYIQDLNMKATYNSLLSSLSGGTQQKVALAKWLFAGSKILFLDEPTRGIDVSARFEIYRMLDKLAEEGLAIFVVSSDLEEVLRISHRMMVMREGKIVAELDKKLLSEELILSYAIGTKTDCA